MKKTACAAIVLVLILLFSVTAMGAETDDVLSAVPEGLRDYLPDFGEDVTPSGIASSFDAGWLLKTVISIISDVAPGAFSSVLTVLGILIVAAVLAVVRDSISGETVKNMLTYVCALCI